jgi:hypothetical protein
VGGSRVDLARQTLAFLFIADIIQPFRVKPPKKKVKFSDFFWPTFFSFSTSHNFSAMTIISTQPDFNSCT